VKQTKHEFCRLLNLLSKQTDGAELVADVLANWVKSDFVDGVTNDCLSTVSIEVLSDVTELLDLETGGGVEDVEVGQLDLIFVIDTTSSMEDDIDQAKARAQEIISQVSESGLDWRIAIVTFRDYPDGEHGALTDYQSRVEVDFTTNTGRISSAIESIVVEEGGDWPESVYSGLMTAMALDWRNGVQKIVVLMGDAPPHDPEPGTGFTEEEVLTTAFNLDPVNLYPILVENDSYVRTSFAALADGSSGRIFTTTSAEELVPVLLETLATATGDTHLAIAGYARIYTTGGDTLNLRAGTNTREEIYQRLPLGTVVEIIGGPFFEYPYIWWQVRAPDGTEGYSVEAADGIATLVNIPKVELEEMFPGE